MFPIVFSPEVCMLTPSQGRRASGAAQGYRTPDSVVARLRSAPAFSTGIAAAAIALHPPALHLRGGRVLWR